MNDYSFDIKHYIFWQQLSFWAINALGILAIVAALVYYNRGEQRKSTTIYSFILFIVTLIILGWWPIEWGLWSDRSNYARRFIRFQKGIDYIGMKNMDYGFSVINGLLSKVCTVAQYFVVIAFLYLANYYIAAYRLVKKQNFWLLIAVVLSMGFISYNTNTMRAGLALSFIVLGLSVYQSKIKMAIFLLIACSIHSSMYIPSIIIFVCCYFDKTPLYIKLWIISIPISFIAGKYFNTLFADILDDKHTTYYLLGRGKHHVYNTGFRVDFILYSLAPILVGWFFIFKKQFVDRFYKIIYNSYLLINILWILVIQSNYSDRFAYLSWFLMPFLLVYPLIVKPDIVNKPNVWLATILSGELVFRFIF